MKEPIWDRAVMEIARTLPMETLGTLSVVRSIRLLFPRLRDSGVRIYEDHLEDNRGVLISWKDEDHRAMLFLRSDGLIDGTLVKEDSPPGYGPAGVAPDSVEAQLFIERLANALPAPTPGTGTADRFIGRLNQVHNLRSEVEALPEGAQPFLRLVSASNLAAGVPLVDAIANLAVDEEEGRGLAWLQQASREAVEFVIIKAGIPDHAYRVPPAYLERDPNDMDEWLLAAAPLLRTAQLSGRPVVEQLEALSATWASGTERRVKMGKAAQAFYKDPSIDFDRAA